MSFPKFFATQKTFLNANIKRTFANDTGGVKQK